MHPGREIESVGRTNRSRQSPLIDAPTSTGKASRGRFRETHTGSSDSDQASPARTIDDLRNWRSFSAALHTRFRKRVQVHCRRASDVGSLVAGPIPRARESDRAAGRVTDRNTYPTRIYRSSSLAQMEPKGTCRQRFEEATITSTEVFKSPGEMP